MATYKVFWKEFFIGMLYVENDKYMFKKDEHELQKAVDSGMAAFLLPESTNEFTDSMPFFENRIKRSNLDVIKYHTDNFKLVKM